jgi:hypothetical protein
MKRIVIAAVIVSFVSVGAFPASKSKNEVTAVTRGANQTVSPPVPLATLFQAPSQETVAANGMVMMEAPNHEVVMVRINDDGSRSHACVNTEAAARAFLSTAKSGTTPARREQ